MVRPVHLVQLGKGLDIAHAPLEAVVEVEGDAQQLPAEFDGLLFGHAVGLDDALSACVVLPAHDLGHHFETGNFGEKLAAVGGMPRKDAPLFRGQ